eukprot:361209-Chlamydomonas_euryale.AAC.4
MRGASCLHIHRHRSNCGSCSFRCRLSHRLRACSCRPFGRPGHPLPLRPNTGDRAPDFAQGSRLGFHPRGQWHAKAASRVCATADDPDSAVC